MSTTGVLFVCLGNICRSPTAEAVFKALVEQRGLLDKFDIDSCGTGGGSSDWYKENGWAYHEGDAADSRMIAAAKKRGYNLTSHSRPMIPKDFQRFEYIIGMDRSNLVDIRHAAKYWISNGADMPPDWDSKISMMPVYAVEAKHKDVKEIPDPYYGGQAGFEKVLDLLEDTCAGLLNTIISKQSDNTDGVCPK